MFYRYEHYMSILHIALIMNMVHFLCDLTAILMHIVYSFLKLFSL